jgi:alpha-1,3-glucan synthase
MDDLDSAVYYSAWNACIAETIKRFPVDLYHINDYHGAIAPLHLLPKTIPCCLSLHNAEFQGLWPMRTPKERDEVCKVFNLDPSIVESYVQFGEVFNLLHAAASYLRIHQKGFGAVGVSNKYGERSYARYPIFWGLKNIGKLPNPDPSDTEPWNAEEEASQVIKVDAEFEASRGALRQQAQEWAGLDVDPGAELFVFVGRWSNQKGIDLIADVFPAVLEKHSRVQLICIGPTIDLYGKFAALKLAEIVKRYPGRVYSKPEFTQLPPFIFTGAEFALIPSRDEPFGLVAVEFGRKGALGVGARVGGLGQMPGWWFTVESTTTKHLHHQFKKSIEDALASKTEVRALMRARSAKQRFPVAKWVEDLNSIQSMAIRTHQEESGSISGGRFRYPSSSRLRFHSHSRNVSNDRLSTYEGESPPDVTSLNRSSDETIRGLDRTLSLGVRNGPGHRSSFIEDLSTEDIVPWNADSYGRAPGVDAPDEYVITREQAEETIRAERINQTLRQLNGGDDSSLHQMPEALLLSRGRSRSRTSRPSPLLLSREGSRSRTPRSSPAGSPEPRGRFRSRSSLLSTRPNTPSGLRSTSVLSLNEVKGSRNDYSLQKVDPTFNDTNEKYYRSFEGMLEKLDGKTSEGDLCIEEYLIESEKEWFKRMRNAKLGRTSREPSANPSARATFSRERLPSPFGSVFERPSTANTIDSNSHDSSFVENEFLLGEDYVRASFLKRWMVTRIADWPIYSLLLALGQIIAANSYQITLLTGGQSQTSQKLYIIGGIYIITSCLWWLMFRSFKSLYVLSVPFVFYGLAFFFIGISPFVGKGAGQDWMRNVATGMYVTASSSGSLFFALNFGDEGKLTPIIPLQYHCTDCVSSRWRANQSLGLPSLRYPRHTTNLHHSTLLLGQHNNRSNGRRQKR